MDRKTRTIMFSDIVGYSRMMGADEAATIRLLDEHNAVIVPIIKEHGGQVLKFIGDAILSSFESATAAIQSAIEIQSHLATLNEDRGGREKILIRIGIHVGDVVLRDNDVFGDGVNIASRIEPLAEAGGICVSQAVYGMVRSVPELRLRHIGQKRLKNIKDKIGVYKVLLGDQKPAFPIKKAMAVLTAVGVLALGIWSMGRLPKAPADEVLRIGLATFYGEGDRAEEEGRLMRRLVESQLRDVFAGAPHVEIVVGGEDDAPKNSEEARKMGNELGAEFLIWGEVFALGDEVEIQPNLTFALEKRINRTAAPMQFHGKGAGQIKLRRLRAGAFRNLALRAAGEFYFFSDSELALEHMEKIEPQDIDSLAFRVTVLSFLNRSAEADVLLKKVEKLDPLHLEVLKARIHRAMISRKMSDALPLYIQYLKIVPDDPWALGEQANTWMYLRKFDKAEKGYRRVLKISPKSARAYEGLGKIDYRRGKLKESVALLLKAVEADPESASAHKNLSIAYVAQGRFENGVAAGRRAVKIGRKEAWWNLEAQTNAMAHLDPTEEYLEGLARLAELRPLDIRPRLDRAIALRRMGRKEESDAAILALAKAEYRYPHHTDLADFFLGTKAHEEVVNAPKDSYLSTYFYLAMHDILFGGDRERAIRYLKECRLNKRSTERFFFRAGSELARLGVKDAS